jgi:hypothetical protein
VLFSRIGPQSALASLRLKLGRLAISPLTEALLIPNAFKHVSTTTSAIRRFENSESFRRYSKNKNRHTLGGRAGLSDVNRCRFLPFRVARNLSLSELGLAHICLTGCLIDCTCRCLFPDEWRPRQEVNVLQFRNYSSNEWLHPWSLWYSSRTRIGS